MSSIDFSGNSDENLRVIYMVKMLSNTFRLSLSKLHLENTQLWHIIGCVNYSLKHLDLSFNSISDGVAGLIAKIASTLEHLDLSNCNLAENGLIIIAKAMKKAHRLKYVDLNYNKISDIAANEIAELVSDYYSLIHLSASNCDLQEDGFLEIATALLKSFDLLGHKLHFCSKKHRNDSRQV